MTTPTLPIVSAVIPVKDRPNLVARAITSARFQTLQEVEIIVVENGSDDPLQIDKLVSGMNDHRIRVLHCNPCANANVARNVGASAASGDFVAYLDSDDEWEPWHLQRAVTALNESDADFFYGGLTVITGRAIKVHEAFDLNGMDPGDYLFGGIGGWAQTSSYVMRRHVLDTIHWDEALRRHQDFDFFINACRAFDSVASRRPVCRVYWTKGESRAHCSASMIAFYKKHYPMFSTRAKNRFAYGKIKLAIKRLDINLLSYFTHELVRLRLRREVPD